MAAKRSRVHPKYKTKYGVANCPEAYLDSTAVIEHLLGLGLMQAELPIPNDVNLIGLVVLMQFMVYDQGFYVSDIQGVLIKPA